MSDNSNLKSQMEITKEVEADAKKLAEKYHVDASRVADILAKTRITEEWNPIAGCRFISLRVRKEARYWPLLEEALPEMGEEALDLFEEVPPDILSDRLLWLYRLMWSGLPVYTREGLIRLTEAFIRNQYENQASLIATGYRVSILWEKFPWLEDRLGNLYPTKAPSSIKPMMENPGKLTYSWATAQNEPCSYEDAPNYNVLDSELITAIERMRPELFDMRLKALNRLLAALKDDQYDDQENIIYTDIVDLFGELPNDILIVADNLMSGKGKVPNAKPGGRKHLNTTGGLTDILEVARHYIAEAQIGLYHNTKEILWDSYSDGKDGDPQFASTPFSAMQHINPKDCYAIFGELVALLVEQNQLTNDMKLVTINALAKRLPNMQSGLEPYIDNALSPIVEQLTASIGKNQQEGNIFIRCEGIWKVRYEGKEEIIPNRKGLCYIALLLEQPDIYFDALKLLTDCRQISMPADDIKKAAIFEDLPDDYESHDNGYDDLVDDDTIIAVKEEKRRLKEQISLQLSKDQNADISEIKEKLTAIDKYLTQVTRISGRPRRVGRVSNKAIENVAQNIRRSRQLITQYFPAVGEHLQKYIKRNIDWSYRPTIQIKWKVRT